MKSWEKLSEFGADMGAHGGVWECPDLFELVDETSRENKWVLLVSINPGGPQGGSATQYFTGDFDGNVFIPDEVSSDIRWIDYGADNYAGVTWSDVPEEDGRRLFIGWMSNWMYANIVPTTAWRSAMTLPRELVLDNDVLKSRPVKELIAIEGEPRTFPLNEPFDLDSDLVKIEAMPSESREFSVILESRDSQQSVQISYSEGSIYVDRTKAGVADFHDQFASKHLASKTISDVHELTIFVDRSSIEVFANNGEVVITEILFPNEPYTVLRVQGFEGGGSITVTPLESIW